MHDGDGARAGARLTSCGTCLQEFPGKTAEESADACRAHVEAGCPKARRIIVTAKDPNTDPKLTQAVEAYLNATVDVDAVIEEVSAAVYASEIERLLWG